MARLRRIWGAGSPDAPQPGQHACTIHTAPPAVARKFPKLSVVLQKQARFRSKRPLFLRRQPTDSSDSHPTSMARKRLLNYTSLQKSRSKKLAFSQNPAKNTVLAPAGPCLMESVSLPAAQPQKLQTTALLGSPDAPRPGQHACTIHTAPPAVARKFPKLAVELGFFSTKVAVADHFFAQGS